MKPFELYDVEEKRLIRNRYRSFLRHIEKSIKREDLPHIRRAFDWSLKAYAGLKRDSGEPYILHPLGVARIVGEEIGLGGMAIVSSLLHEVVKHGAYPLEDVKHFFGPGIASIVDGLTKLSGINTKSHTYQAENFRKLLLSLAKDVRVILIKIADRLENMRNLQHGDIEKQQKTAEETFLLYAPLAHRLGLYSIKSELEDLSLKYTDNKSYTDVTRKLRDTKSNRDRFIRQFIKPIKQQLDQKGFSYEIKGRTKSVFSVLQKMKKQHVPFEEVYDVFAIRIILNSKPEDEKADCWRTYSIVTDCYLPNPQRLRDWITVPKNNGYESLHTTVIGPNGKWVEVQIRTSRMDEIAEKGFAAHWMYKGIRTDKGMDEWLLKIREALETPETHAREFLDSLTLNLYADEVFVFTPKGDLKKFPSGATVLDFAFDVHTDVGYHCTAAIVNSKNVPIKYILQNGDQVSIITTKNQKPKLDWLNYVVTSKARNKIKQAVNEEKYKLADTGKEIIKRRFKNWKVEYSDENVQKLLKYYKSRLAIDFYALVAEEKIDLAEVKEILLQEPEIKGHESLQEKTEPVKNNEFEKVHTGKPDYLVIDNKVENIDYTLSKCCNPIFGDAIFGFVTINEGIKVHRTGCPNALYMNTHFPYRIIPARWKKVFDNPSFQAVIKITGLDEMGIVNKISDVVSKELKMNMRSMSMDSDKGGFEGIIKVFVPGTSHLDMLLNKLRKIKGVTRAIRVE